MPDFVAPQQPDPNDPEAIKKALLAKLFGSGLVPPGAIAPGGTTPAPGTTPPAAPGTPPTTQPNASNAAASAPAQPLSTAKPPVAKPFVTPTAEEPGNQPPPEAPILSQEEFAKQNPAAPHTPYQAPDLKHRMLMGLFAGLQQFGRDPGAGERMLGNYLGDIEQKTEQEKNYPTTSADTARKRYMDYVAGAKAPIDLEDVKSQIAERQEHAKDLAAQAAARANPQEKVQHTVVEDPAHPGEPKAAYFSESKKAYIDPDTQQPIPGAKPFEHQSTAPPKVEYDNGIPTGVTSAGKTYSIHDPNLPPELKPLVNAATAAHKQYLEEQTAREARAATRGQTKEERQASRKEVSDHDRMYVKPAEDIEKSYQMMDGAYRDYKAAKAQGKDLPTGAQSMLALSSHLTTTFGNVKGARITKEMIQEHLGARGISDSAVVAIQKLTNGDVLSPDQWEAFHNLIGSSRKLSWQTAVKEAARKKIPVDFLPRDLGSLADEAESKSGQHAGGVDPTNPLGFK